MAPSLEAQKRASGAPVFLISLWRAFLRPTAWMTCFLGVASFSLIGALPVYRWVNDTLEHRYEPGSQLHSFDMILRTDHGGELTQLFGSVAASSGWLALFVMLFGVFTAGGWVRVVADPHQRSGRLFFAGGARYYWRFLRLALLVLLLLSAVTWLIQGSLWDRWVLEGLLGWEDAKSEYAQSERIVVQATWLQDVLYLVGVSLVLVWAVFTRVRMALENSQSCFVAGLSSFWLILRHPLATLRPMILLGLLEGSVLVLMGWLVRWLQGLLEGAGGTTLGAWVVFVLIVLGLLGLMVREVVHGARYATAMMISRALVRPLVADPWGDQIGGPGGPQYPLGDDEFRIAL